MPIVAKSAVIGAAFIAGFAIGTAARADPQSRPDPQCGNYGRYWCKRVRSVWFMPIARTRARRFAPGQCGVRTGEHFEPDMSVFGLKDHRHPYSGGIGPRVSSYGAI
jgi:hypothetical protein